MYNRKSNAKNAREREIIHFYFNFMSDNIAGTWQTRKSEKQRIRVQLMFLFWAFYTYLSQDFIYLQQSWNYG